MRYSALWEKEMVLGSLSKETLTPLVITSAFKLLGGHSQLGSLKWDNHVTAIVSTAVKRMWFLKKLKRAGVSVKDRVKIIRPVLEYACPAWHSSLTTEQTKTY